MTQSELSYNICDSNIKLSDRIKTLDKPGRDKFKQLCNKLGYIYSEPANEKLAYDAMISYKGKNYVIEIKNRSLDCEKYDTLFLEQDKYYRVQAWKDRLNADGAYYVNWIGDTAYIFNLDDEQTTKTLEKKWMNSVTAKSRTQKIQKNVYIINKDLATVYNL